MLGNRILLIEDEPDIAEPLTLALNIEFNQETSSVFLVPYDCNFFK